MPFSTIASPRKAVRKSNPIAKAKRKAAYRKMLSGKEYKAARAEAMGRAEHRCEQEGVMTLHWSEEYGLHEKPSRCQREEGLHAHHLRYPKTRPLAARDLKILCRIHHEEAESQKPHKTRMF